MIGAVPDGEELVVVILCRKGLVERGEHGGRIVEASRRQTLQADRVGHGDGEQRRADTVARDVEEIKGKAIGYSNSYSS